MKDKKENEECWMNIILAKVKKESILKNIKFELTINIHLNGNSSTKIS